MKENKFQSWLINELKNRFPGCIVCKGDSSYIQGIPDLIILFGSQWAALEAKRNKKASHRPNQDYWVKRMNDMSFSEFVYPENVEDVLYRLTKFFNKQKGEMK